MEKTLAEVGSKELKKIYIYNLCIHNIKGKFPVVMSLVE